MKNKTLSDSSLKKEFQTRLGRLWPLAKGSVAQVYKPCIHPQCRACKEGRKHQAFIFSYRQSGKTRCLYVPASLVPKLRLAIKNGRRLEKLLARLGCSLIKRSRRSHKDGGS